MDTQLYNWLQQQFYYSNHTKYRKYFEEWISNITPDQVDGYRNQMNAKLQKPIN
jgi:hypothetical protein